MNVHLLLFYDKDAPAYRDVLPSMITQCVDLRVKLGIGFDEFDSKTMSNAQRAEVINEIREIIPQGRGSIVTSRGSMLPLSKSKNLNLGNTPILLVNSKRKPIYVFPCRVGETYYDIPLGLSHLRKNLPSLPQLNGEMEESIAKRVKESPRIEEEGLKLLGEEVDTLTGKADLVFLDKKGKHLIIEVEREATDAALGQVLRHGAGYEEKSHLTREDVRVAIACTRIHKFVETAAKWAGIEIWKV